MKICLIFILLFIISCDTVEKRQSNKINLLNWGSFTFVDTLGEKTLGLYQNYKGEHRVIIARDSPDMEKVIVIELLHAQGFRHNTKATKKIFDEKMAGYGY